MAGGVAASLTPAITEYPAKLEDAMDVVWTGLLGNQPPPELVSACKAETGCN